MSFRFFDNAINGDMQQMPNDLFRGIEQAFVNEAWDNTTALYTVKQQKCIGSNVYEDIEAWVDTTVADTTTGQKVSQDFLKLIFRDINHRVKRGLMYQFDNNYWIVHNYGEYSGVVQQCGIRRCNNRLKIVNPSNGKVEVFPCCVDYDMGSPSTQISRYVITPNNHAVVILQANDLSLELLKLNTRYIISGRPFKLYAYQNAIEDSELNQQTTLIYLEMYLDEIHDGDDLINGIADNGQYDYSIKIDSENTVIGRTGGTGNLTATVMLNGTEISREVEWTSDNSQIVAIGNLGNYILLGNVGQSAIISANIKGNNAIKDSIAIEISTEDYDNISLTLDPMIDKIRQFETIQINPIVDYNGTKYTNFDTLEISVIDPAGCVSLKGNSVTGAFASPAFATIRVDIANISPAFTISKSFNIQVVSMMG